MYDGPSNERNCHRRTQQIAGALFSLLLLASSSFACSIPPGNSIRRSPRDAFDRAQEVFVARTLSIEVIDDYFTRVTFQVSAVLKGGKQHLRTVVQNRGLGCQVTPPVGLERLFFVTPVPSPIGDAYSISHIGPRMDDVLTNLPPPIWRAAK